MSLKIPKLRLASLLCVLLQSAAMIAPPTLAIAADETNTDNLPWKRGGIYIGALLTNFGSDARVDSSDGERGTDLNLEDDLSLNNNLTDFRIDAFWRFSPRHRAELTYYDVSREGNATIDRDIRFGDRTFGLNGELNSEIGFKVIKLSYAYSFIQNSRWDVAGSIGMHGIDLKASLGGQAQGGIGFSASRADVFAPLPVIGGRVSYALTPKLKLRNELDLFALDLGNMKGHLIDARVNFDYDLTSNVGLSLGYNFVETGIEFEDGLLLGDFDYKYSGLTFAARYYF